MRKAERILAGAVVAAVVAAALPVLTAAGPSAGPAAGGVSAAACVCGGTRPTPPTCWNPICNCQDLVWEVVPAATTATCNDGDPCTYSDHCDGQGSCARGTRVPCTSRGPCEAILCNGTSTCSVAMLAAGSACPTLSQPGANPCEAVCDGVSPYCQPQ